MSQVHSELWSQHDTDVGLMKSASLIHIKLKQGTQIRHKAQYSLKDEASLGRSRGVGENIQFMQYSHFSSAKGR